MNREAAQERTAPAGRKRMSPHAKRVLKKHLFVYGMLSVAIIHFFIFYFYVNIDSFLMAFQDQHTGEWGFSNFILFFNDIARGANSEILLNLKNTIYYFLTGILSNLISFLLAYFIFKKIFLYKFFRFVFVVPMIVSSVVLVSIYRNLLASGGPVAVLWEAISGSPAPSFLYDPRYATLSIIVFVLWTGMGMNIILFSGAMNRIPESVIEYGKLDGVSNTREMFQIVLPIIAPTFGTIMLLSCIGIFNASGPILLFSGGRYGTSTINYWMYQYVIVNNQLNYAAAFGLALTVFSLPIFFLMRFLVNKLPDDVTY